MYFFNDKCEKIRIFFLQHVHLEMAKSHNVPLKDLTSLLYYNVAREDLLSWISYQRAMEETLFNRKFTCLDTTPILKFADKHPKHDMELLTPELNTIYKESKYYDDANFYSYTFYDGVLAIISHNTELEEDGYTHGERNLTRTIYQALLSKIGYQRFYSKEPIKDKDEFGITLAELISILST